MGWPPRDGTKVKLEDTNASVPLPHGGVKDGFHSTLWVEGIERGQ
ncbi:MAG: hypothetical protein MjAS7_1293 [Metallosphaera javensis (ex Sakai et al. 2022)]|nr:MAG: hypothetical protein MjAS7_1293 [Metallosphaera javensis (ex Sakai et al. 2022)]